jgi:hypothetical protein
MAKYLVRWDYVSSWGGPFSASQVLDDLDEERAAAINRDSPGVLVRLEDEPPPAVEEAVEERAEVPDEDPIARRLDRMERRAKHRGQGGVQEPIDRTVFKATKS